MEISTLLNPDQKSRLRSRNLPAPRYTRDNTEDESSEVTPGPLDMTKKSSNKTAKDAAKFEKGPTAGIVRFPPFEAVDEDLKEKHGRFHLYPKDGIAKYPRHIPYKSDKKTFQEKTSRDSFEVFQYTFKYPSNSKEWVVMWDYNIGLVRITPFFKALGHAKTVPQKAIDMSPGLRELCYSITGGSIAAQGYWMPFEAAKALTATFCWPIRYALTPLFGNDFPEQCIEPEDPVYRKYVVCPDIIRRCEEEASAWALSSESAASTESTSPSDDGRFEQAGHSASVFPERRLRRRSGRFYGDNGSPDDAYNDSHGDDAYFLAAQPSTYAAAEHIYYSKDFTSASNSPSPWASSVPTSPTTRHHSPAAKRGLADEDGAAHPSRLAAAIIVEKRRRVGVFGADEMMAAQALLKLSRGRR